MDTIGISDAKTHLSRLIREVSAGKVFVITKNGIAVAQLSSPQVARASSRLTTEAAVHRLRSRKVLLGRPIRRALASGRRGAKR